MVRLLKKRLFLKELFEDVIQSEQQSRHRYTKNQYDFQITGVFIFGFRLYRFRGTFLIWCFHYELFFNDLFHRHDVHAYHTHYRR
jgi:hypothetical protein